MNDDVNMDKIRDKIRKLLAVANGMANENESLTAARQAAKMMEKYSLSMADVIEKDLEADANLVKEWANEWRYKRAFPSYYSWIALAAARLYDCEARLEWEGIKGYGLRMYGYKADVEIATWTLAFLHSTGSYLSEKYWDSVKHEHDPRQSQFVRKSFLEGYANRMCNRLEEMKNERQVAITSSGTQLVILKKDAIERVFGEFSYSSSKAKDPDAHVLAGYREGGKVNLNNPISAAEEKVGIK